jgi:hypothetical protein
MVLKTATPSLKGEGVAVLLADYSIVICSEVTLPA